MTTQKKIVLVSPAHPYRGGQALVEAYLFHMLSTMGFDCHTVSYKLLYPSVFFPGTTQYDNSEIVPFEHKDKIRFLINSINPLTWLKAAKEIKKMNPDGVIFVWWMPFFGPALSTIARLLKRRGIKILFLVENYVSHEKRWFDHFMTQQTLKYADAFITESQYITKQVTEGFPGKPVHQATLSIYDCYDLKKYDKSSAREHLGIKTDKVILFFGLIRPYKGLDKLLVAFRHLADKRNDITLLIAGESYEDEKKYTDLIASLGIGSQVVYFNKFIPNEQVEPYFKAADVVCLPYQSGTQSGILMMAYGFNVPVAVTDVGGIAELVEDGKTGKVIKGNTTEDITAALAEVLDNPSGTDYAENIRNKVTGMGYKSMQTYLERILQK
jgi:glycosyltransferase involved in cell wall biosynthesis